MNVGGRGEPNEHSLRFLPRCRQQQVCLRYVRYGGRVHLSDMQERGIDFIKEKKEMLLYNIIAS